MKGLTTVLTVMIIIIISISMMTVLWLFLSGTFANLRRSADKDFNNSMATMSSCMRIESVSGSQVFLRNCGKGAVAMKDLNVYLDDKPLGIMASGSKTFGKTDIGSDCTNYFGANTLEATVRRQATENGIINAVSIYIFTGGNVRVSIYADNSGYPGQLLGESSPKLCNSGEWCRFTGFSVPITGGNWYWIGGQQLEQEVRICSEDPGQTSLYDQSIPWGPFPNTFPVGAITESIEYSMYVDYTTQSNESDMIGENEVGAIDLSGLDNFESGVYVLKATSSNAAAEKTVELSYQNLSALTSST